MPSSDLASEPRGYLWIETSYVIVCKAVLMPFAQLRPVNEAFQACLKVSYLLSVYMSYIRHEVLSLDFSWQQHLG